MDIDNFEGGKGEEFSKIYTPFSQIKFELEKRRKDKDLMKKVEIFFGSNMPNFMGKYPHAVLSRSIATPNVELSYFLELSKELALDPLILEFPDKLVAKNLSKYYLCKLFFFRKNKKGNSIVVDTKNIINFNKDEGKELGKITTIYGDKLIDMHHKILLSKFPELKNKFIDFSDWFSKTRYISKYYYLYFLSLFVCHGVLFENFLFEDKEEANFIKDKFLPSFKQIESLFGVKPLIYPLLPFKQATNTYWHSYPEELKADWLK